MEPNQGKHRAALAGSMWGLVVALVTATATAWQTDRPATRIEPDGEVLYFKGPHGPDWRAVALAAGVVGVAAGFAGAVWAHTRPE